MGDVRSALHRLASSLLALSKGASSNSASHALRDFRKQKLEFAQKECSQVLESLPSQFEQQTQKLRACISTKKWDEALILVRSLEHQLPQQMNTSRIPLPSDIAQDVYADIDEIHRCFSNECLRSAIILCGRVLETALHRKYYEITRNDLLETSPGLGLGKLIAKLKEANISLPVGLTEQIHLINNVRISSVHRKSELFVPTTQQAQAIILFTLDVLRALFGPKSVKLP